ncbi:hypothetical protein [Herbaspirillum sp. RV1423]|uniref:hypothetical protein n=1 Tax=Herbaspirillum sp. RV1423 TaxID=1443993 RepID=UPI00054DD46D|nr:hypothetical protein [Herbaspirillum sp. RV1423]
MKMPPAIASLRNWRRKDQYPAPVTTEAASTVTTAAPALSVQLMESARKSLDDQMREVFDRNADGINRAAKSIRDQSDSLLSLGITDDRVARAGTLSQLAVELANKGRGQGLDQVRHVVDVNVRWHHVETALATIAQAELLMREATAENKKQIRTLFQRQEKMLKLVRQNPLTESFVK